MIEFLKKLIGLKPSIIIDDVDSPFMRVSLKELSHGDRISNGEIIESLSRFYGSYRITTTQGSYWVNKGHYVTIYRR